ncbi:response regulator [Salimicrobium halophilum]|uniref:DNA-binding response regulator, NarL/FixJ family, contains REC and HTH domains n=1 Tax=Salimicrobium halophilum TaxID=86666 RepID=A0A1G8WL21_9BACI|nr:response regulator transcription factor [Salimicrobium halophilum]SDJ79062.1 DNA-binding response regulator, NarL/FixJ family, contains REC and HTH domains [Salimicrobium halophilum]
MRPIRIMIADDHAVNRDGLKTILSEESDFEVVAIAKNGEEALKKMEDTAPDVILLDWKMPGLSGIQVMEQTREEMKDSCFLILSSHHDDLLALEALKKGATGFLLKDWETEDIIRAVRACARGIMIFPDYIAPTLRRSLVLKKEKAFPSLTDPEEEVLVYMAEEMKNKEIAETLYLSEGTIRNYISSIYKKLGVHKRSEAIALFKKRNVHS